MAANHSIKELMSAESKASKIVSAARQERGERLKQAKQEAELEINAYRQQLENAFQLNATDLLCEDSSVLDQEVEHDIAQMTQSFHLNKQTAIDLMVNQSCRVVSKVPEARKRSS